MAVYNCECLNCRHCFYSLQVQCRDSDTIKCPLCAGGVVIDDIELPEGREWGECAKKNSSCRGCKKND